MSHLGYRPYLQKPIFRAIFFDCPIMNSQDKSSLAIDAHKYGLLFVFAAGVLWSTVGLGIRMIEDAVVWQILLYRSISMSLFLYLVIRVRSGESPFVQIRRTGFSCSRSRPRFGCGIFWRDLCYPKHLRCECNAALCNSAIHGRSLRLVDFKRTGSGRHLDSYCYRPLRDSNNGFGQVWRGRYFWEPCCTWVCPWASQYLRLPCVGAGLVRCYRQYFFPAYSLSSLHLESVSYLDYRSH